MERRLDKLDKKLKEILEQPGAEGRSGEVTDNPRNRKEARKFAELLLVQTEVERPCFICGKPLGTEGAMSSVVLGPIAAGGGSASAHNDCYQSRLEAHPEIRASLGKGWRRYSTAEKEMWIRAFSEVVPGEGFGKLFKKP